MAVLDRAEIFVFFFFFELIKSGERAQRMIMKLKKKDNRAYLTIEIIESVRLFIYRSANPTFIKRLVYAPGQHHPRHSCFPAAAEENYGSELARPFFPSRFADFLSLVISGISRTNAA